ncbi:MAG: ATP-binding protein [Candidatus Kapabacteria bacterium]|nr:ATP-binding protein [Candidatus Kapabacteria bacterium]
MEANKNNHEELTKVLIISDDLKTVNEIKELSDELFISLDFLSSDNIIKSGVSLESHDILIVDSELKAVNYKDFLSIYKNNFDNIYTPILILTPNDNKEFLKTIITLNVNDYILKPLNLYLLLIKLKNLILISNLSKMLIEARNDFIQKNKEKNELLGLTAHDLKNPINSISMLSKVLRDADELSQEEIKEYSSDIASTAERMLSLIKELLDFNAIEEGRIKIKPEELELNEIISEVADFYMKNAEKKDISINIELPDETVYVKTDRNAIVQILDNLISNAVKYTAQGKKVGIILKKSNNLAIVEIKDEGPGFTEEDKKKLFQKFSKLSAKPTAGEHSTGLGLSIVKKYADLIGADIKLESEAGKGSTFFITLPIVDIEN